jgi:hypothetical protein
MMWLGCSQAWRHSGEAVAALMWGGVTIRRAHAPPLSLKDGYIHQRCESTHPILVPRIYIPPRNDERLRSKISEAA